MEIQHSIQYAARQAGITPHVIRAWEKRYHAVSPHRSQTNRRLYSNAEVARLGLLARLTNHGHRISDIAQHPTETLTQMAAPYGKEPPETATPKTGFSCETAINESITAIRALESEPLLEILHQSARALGQRGILERVISPLARRIGDLWAEGILSAAHEHFASNILKVYLLNGARAYADDRNAPAMVITTPIGQLHELGAALIAAYARDLGWRVLYLGPSLPSIDIAHVASTNAVKAVVLSVVYPADDPELVGELKSLRTSLPAQTAMIVGGESASAYAGHLENTGIIFTNNLDEFSGHLKRLRQGVSSS